MIFLILYVMVLLGFVFFEFKKVKIFDDFPLPGSMFPNRLPK